MLETNFNFRLAECEAKITNGLRSFYEAGKALCEIRDKQLYKSTGYGTFEDYCQVKWRFTRNYAKRLIDAYSIVNELEETFKMEENVPIGTFQSSIVIPTTETQARPLTKLESPELRKEAWEKVVKEAEETNEPITQKKVEEVVKQYCNPCENAMTFRIITYLNPYYHKKFEELKRGEKESEFLRKIVQTYCDDLLTS